MLGDTQTASPSAKLIKGLGELFTSDLKNSAARQGSIHDLLESLRPEAAPQAAHQAAASAQQPGQGVQGHLIAEVPLHHSPPSVGVQVVGTGWLDGEGKGRKLAARFLGLLHGLMGERSNRPASLSVFFGHTLKEWGMIGPPGSTETPHLLGIFCSSQEEPHDAFSPNTGLVRRCFAQSHQCFMELVWAKYTQTHA